MALVELLQGIKLIDRSLPCRHLFSEEKGRIAHEDVNHTFYDVYMFNFEFKLLKYFIFYYLRYIENVE